MDPNPNYVALLGEYDIPKTNLEPYLKVMRESSKAFSTWSKQGLVKDFQSWTDNTGHFVIFILFESIEKFAEIWNKEEFHKFTSESSMFLENVRLRLMRPAFLPE
ncbi:MAG: hypothetical protein ACFFE6_06965 [Candidatus Thorarchaeota archaeon]